MPEEGELEPVVGRDSRTMVIGALLLLFAAATVAAVAISVLSGRPSAPAPQAGAGGLASARALPTMAPSAASSPAAGASSSPAPQASSSPAPQASSSSVAPPSSSPSTAPSSEASPTPTESGGEVAGSNVRTLDFDMLPNEAAVSGWTLSGAGELKVAAVPTAVDRSARLAAPNGATACLPLDIVLGTLTAEFMLETTPSAEHSLVSVALQDGTALDLVVTDGGARIDKTSDPVPLEAGTWYRWVVTRERPAVVLQLLSSEDALLAEARVPAENPQATEFCMNVDGRDRVYLDQLNVEEQ